MAIATPLPCTYCGSVEHGDEGCPDVPLLVEAHEREPSYRPHWKDVVGLRRQHDKAVRNDVARILDQFDKQFEEVRASYEKLATAQNSLAGVMDGLNVAMENTRRFVAARTFLGRCARLIAWLRGRPNPYRLALLPTADAPAHHQPVQQQRPLTPPPRAEIVLNLGQKSTPPTSDFSPPPTAETVLESGQTAHDRV